MAKPGKIQRLGRYAKSSRERLAAASILFVLRIHRTPVDQRKPARAGGFRKRIASKTNCSLYRGHCRSADKPNGARSCGRSFAERDLLEYQRISRPQISKRCHEPF